MSDEALRSIVDRILRCREAEDEAWRQVDGFSRYAVSSLGRIANLAYDPPRILKGSFGTTTMRYRRVGLVRDDGQQLTRNVHVMVASAFCGPRPKGCVARHRDGDVSNNSAENIGWGTPAENSRDRVEHGRSGKGEANPNAKLTDQQTQMLVEAYRRGSWTQKQLGRMFGVRQAHVSRLVRNSAHTQAAEITHG